MPNETRRGLVVLEAILALAVLAVVIGIAARAVVTQTHLAADAGREVAARQALFAEVERLRALPFEDLARLTGSSKRDAATDDLPKGALEVTIAPEGDDSLVSLVRIAVTVTWASSQGSPRSRGLSTLQARAGGPR